jgi:hypothetical protein
VAARPIYLFEPKKTFEYGQGPEMGASANGAGQKDFSAPSPQHGAEIVYKLATTTRDTVRIVITDAKGDTVRTLPGSGRAGLNRVVWDLRGRAPRRTLTISQRRDSVVQAHRVDFVLDSLIKAGTLTAQQAEGARRLAGGGGGFGGGGGGGFGGGGNQAAAIGRLGPGGVFATRPGEGGAAGAGRGAGGGGGGGAAAGGEGGGESGNPQDLANSFPGGFQEIAALLRPAGQRGGGGGFGGNQAPIAMTGDYLVTLKVGNEVQRQVLRIEHVNTNGTPTVTTFDEDEPHDP